MSKTQLTQPEYEQIVRAACEEPFGQDVIVVDAPDPTEKDYLYAVWRAVAKYIEMETPMLLPANGRTEIQLLRDEIDRLVAGHQSTNYPIHPTLYEHINAALGKSG